MSPRQLIFLGVVALATVIVAMITGPLLLGGLMDDPPAQPDRTPTHETAPHPAAQP